VYTSVRPPVSVRACRAECSAEDNIPRADGTLWANAENVGSVTTKISRTAKPRFLHWHILYILYMYVLYNLYMKNIPSSEFRVSYAALTEPVEVTANRRLLGTWYPAGMDTKVHYEDLAKRDAPPVTIDSFAAEEIARLKRELASRPPVTTVRPIMPGTSFNSRPFTPVPKTGKKK